MLSDRISERLRSDGILRDLNSTNGPFRMPQITFDQSGAFIERFTLPATRSGPLDGLSFAVKDIIDVAGHRTGFGNPTWLDTHPPATVSAVCVEQILQAGARCEGK